MTQSYILLKIVSNLLGIKGSVIYNYKWNSVCSQWLQLTMYSWVMWRSAMTSNQLYAIMTLCFTQLPLLFFTHYSTNSREMPAWSFSTSGVMSVTQLCHSLSLYVFFTFTIFSAFSPLVALFDRKLTKERKL